VVSVVTVREFDLINFSLVNGVPTPTNGSRLNPFGEIDFKTSGGRDNFNALQLTVNRRFAKGLTLGGHYQWGQSADPILWAYQFLTERTESFIR